jgi:hypothetical protein
MVEWLEGWKVGRLEGWKVGRLKGWKVGRLEGGKVKRWKSETRPGICGSPRSVGANGGSPNGNMDKGSYMDNSVCYFFLTQRIAELNR